MLRLGGVLVYADHDFFFGFELPLEFISRIRDFHLGKTFFNGGNHAAHGVDLFDIFPGLFLDFVRERFDKVRAGQRINGIGHARFFGQNLLGAQRDFHCLFGRQTKNFVQ